MRNPEITNYDDIIDSHNVIARIDDLETERKDATDKSEFDESDEGQELTALKKLTKQGEDFSEWKYGITLIRDSYFEEYAQELAIDIGAIQPNLSWPYTCIDWKLAARDLQYDYSALEFDGVTYWAR